MADAASESPPAPVQGQTRRKRRFFLQILLLVVVLAAASWALWYFLEGRWYTETDDAYVGGNIVQITPRIAGTVIRIGADDGDFVQAGQTLVEFDPSDTHVALAAAEAELAQAVRQARGLYNNVAAARAEAAARKVELGKAQADYQRRVGLARTGAISAEILAHARDALHGAESALVTAEQHQRNAEALVAGTTVATNPAVKAAEARLRKAFLDDAHTRMVAPVTGYVAKRTVQLGELVSPGRALMAVIPLDDVWVDANFKETQLEHMRIGQEVSLVADLYGRAVTYHGTVASLGVGTGSAFSLLPAQNATGNWIKIVQRLPVRVRLDEPGQLQAHPLRIGLSMTARVNLHERDGELLPTQAPTAPILATAVYEEQLAAADARVEEIVQANLEQGSQ